MFSLFSNHSQNTPIGSLSLQELHRQLVNPDREPFVSAVYLIQQLRFEPDEIEQKRIKSKLPAFTPNAQVDTKDKLATPEQRNIRFSGFMQIDIDLHENPNMTDAAAIRNKIAQIPYIVLSAISARGKGVWALIALAEPGKFTQYIEPVFNYFKQARVTIDKSKSKNPTELRYFAPDPAAILKTDYKLFPLISCQSETSPYQKSQINSVNVGKVTTLTEMQRWVTETTGYNLVDGQKHLYIFWLSYALRKNGLCDTEVFNTIHSNILSSDQIKSNCISGGIAYANTKGLYTPRMLTSYSQAIFKPQKESKVLPVNNKFIPPPLPPDIKHHYFGPDGLLHIHYPGIPYI